MMFTFRTLAGAAFLISSVAVAIDFNIFRKHVRNTRTFMSNVVRFEPTTSIHQILRAAALNEILEMRRHLSILALRNLFHSRNNNLGMEKPVPSLLLLLRRAVGFNKRSSSSDEWWRELIEEDIPGVVMTNYQSYSSDVSQFFFSTYFHKHPTVSEEVTTPHVATLHESTMSQEPYGTNVNNSFDLPVNVSNVSEASKDNHTVAGGGVDSFTNITEVIYDTLNDTESNSTMPDLVEYSEWLDVPRVPSDDDSVYPEIEIPEEEVVGSFWYDEPFEDDMLGIIEEGDLVPVDEDGFTDITS